MDLKATGKSTRTTRILGPNLLTDGCWIIECLILVLFLYGLRDPDRIRKHRKNKLRRWMQMTRTMQNARIRFAPSLFPRLSFRCHIQSSANKSSQTACQMQKERFLSLPNGPFFLGVRKMVFFYIEMVLSAHVLFRT